MSDKRFQIIEHPSELGILAFGENQKETFENAAFGMFSLIAEIEEIESVDSFKIEVKGQDFDELMVNWLNELIFIEDSKKILFKEFNVYQINEHSLKAQVSGQHIKEGLHELHRKIKAATYSQLEVKEKKAKILFNV
jgi:SHS2 domain-containing protein